MGIGFDKWKYFLLNSIFFGNLRHIGVFTYFKRQGETCYKNFPYCTCFQDYSR